MKRRSLLSVEHRVSLLKERIYATIILLAVLVTINPAHTKPFNLLVVIGGTVFSVWAASIVASQMSRRIIMGSAEGRSEARDRINEHSPLLAAGAFPLFLAGLAYVDTITVEIAVNLSLAFCLILMAAWSLLSARTIGAGRGVMIISACLQLLIGMGIVMLKVIVEH